MLEVKKRTEEATADLRELQYWTEIANTIIMLAYRDWETDRKGTRLNSSHSGEARMPSSA